MPARQPHALLCLLLACAVPAGAAAGGLPLRAYSLSSAPALTTPDEPLTPVDPRAAAIAARVPGLFAGAREKNSAEVVRRGLSKRALASTLSQSGAAMEVHLRPGSGTPMLLRVAASGSGGRARLRQSDEGTAREFLRAQREVLGLDDPDDELELERQETDELGRRHLRFAQTYGGVPVWPGEVAVHLDAAGAVTAVNGAYVRSPRHVRLEPGLGAEAAVEIARGIVARTLPGDTTATATELIVYAPLRKKPRLAWKVELDASLSSRWIVVVDALDGRKLNAFDRVAKAAQTGSGLDVFGHETGLHLWAEDSSYFLVDTSKAMFDPTSDPPNPDTTRGGIVVLDARNQPPTDDPQTLPDLFAVTAAEPNGPWLNDGVSAAFSLSETYDYYLERHGRDSIDGAGGSLIAVVRLGQNLMNAFWTNGLMLFGDAAPYPGGLDVAAHELTHGITERTANLTYQNQSGAANEAFSDIFGENVEARSFGSADWLKAAQITAPIQNYADCGALSYLGRPYPSRMSQYVNTDEDSGGVHGNSCIVNHAYYLLAAGLPDAIGIAAAEKIFYRALTLHLVRNSQFVDVRLACVLSAEELFGAGSPQVLRTGEAFDAVEIFDGAATPPPPDFPEVDGPDATVYVLYDSDQDDFFLGRRESALGDPDEGVGLSGFAVKAQRPSVSGDGSMVVFVSSANDACIIPTNAGEETFEECLGDPGAVYSVAISRDQSLLAFVLRDENGTPLNTISVVDTVSGDVRTFPLRAPLVDGHAIGTVLFAEVMDFTADGRFLVYDAFDQFDLGGGTTSGFYSVYALDLVNDRTLQLVTPEMGVDVGNPSLAQTSDNYLALDVVENGVGHTAAIELTTGDAVEVSTIEGTTFPVGIPGYSGDDAAIIYTQADANTVLGLSLFRQQVDERQTPSGAPTLWLSDAVDGVVYRRGAFSAPEPTPTPTRVPTALPTSSPTPAACVGDCDHSGGVVDSEVIADIEAALVGTPVGLCGAGGDGPLTVDTLVRAVLGHVYGCIGAP